MYWLQLSTISSYSLFDFKICFHLLVESNFRYNLQPNHIYSISYCGCFFQRWAEWFEERFEVYPFFVGFVTYAGLLLHGLVGHIRDWLRAHGFEKCLFAEEPKPTRVCASSSASAFTWQNTRDKPVPVALALTLPVRMQLSWDVFTSVRVCHIAKTPIFGFPLPPPFSGVNAHSIMYIYV